MAAPIAATAPPNTIPVMEKREMNLGALGTMPTESRFLFFSMLHIKP